MDFISSLKSLGLSKLASAPTNRVSNYYQVQFYYPPLKHNQITYQSLYWKIYSEEGVLGFWKVTPIDIVRQVLTNIIQKPLSTYLQKIPYITDQQLQGLLLSSLSLAIVYPLDVIRLNLSIDIGNKKFQGFVDCISKIIKNRGVTGLYTGLVISIVGIYVYRLTYSYLYKAMRRIQSYFSRVPSQFESLLLGYSVTLLAGILTYPLSVIRNTMVLQSTKHNSSYSGMFQSVATIIKLEGFNGLFGGLSRHILNSFFGFIAMVAYERMKPQQRRRR